MQPPADKPDANQASSVDGLSSSHNFTGSGKVIQPSPGFDPNAATPPKLVDPEAEDASAPEPPIPTDPTPAPPPPPGPSTPLPGPVPGPVPGSTTVMPGPVDGTDASPPPIPPVPPGPPTAAAASAGGEYISNPFKLFGPSWRALKLNVGSLLVALLAYIGTFLAAAAIIGILAFIGSIVGGPTRPILVAVGFIAGIVVAVALIVRIVGAFMVLILASARGTKMSFGQALTTGKPYGWRLLGYTILYAIIVAVGWVLLIVPGILFQTWFSFGPYLIVDENLGVFAAFSRSKQLMSGHFWESFGPLGVMSIFGALGIIPILGWIAELILYVPYSLALPIRYVTLKSYKDHNTPFPPRSPVNVILPILVVVALVTSFAIGGYALIHQWRNLSTPSNPGMSINYPG